VSEEVQKTYEAAKAKYMETQKRVQHAAFINEVRERTKLASNVAPRPTEELRGEERTAIYRRLLRQLTAVGDPDKIHITAELIHAIFDIDAMLYFVAPEWWMPRQHSRQQPAGGEFSLQAIQAAALMKGVGSALQTSIGLSSPPATDGDVEPEYSL